MRLKILTPERVVFDEDGVEGVNAQSTGGAFGVLPKHLPLVTPLDVSLLTYNKSGKQHTVTVMGGLFRTDGQQVTVLADAAELSNEIDKTPPGFIIFITS